MFLAYSRVMGESSDLDPWASFPASVDRLCLGCVSGEEDQGKWVLPVLLMFFN